MRLPALSGGEFFCNSKLGLQPFYDYLDTNNFKTKELPCVALFLWLGVTSVTPLQALQALHPVTL